MEKRNVRISIEKFREFEQELKLLKNYNEILESSNEKAREEINKLKDKLKAEKNTSKYFEGQVQTERILASYDKNEVNYLTELLARKETAYNQHLEERNTEIEKLKETLLRSTEDLSKEIERRMDCQKGKLRLIDEKYLWMSRYHEEKIKPWWKRIFNK